MGLVLDFFFFAGSVFGVWSSWVSGSRVSGSRFKVQGSGK